MNARSDSTRQFTIVVAAVLAIVGIAPLLHGGAPRWIVLFVGATVTGVGLFSPKALAVPARWWMAIAALLNRVASTLLLTIVFFVVVTPIGFARRLRKKDGLQRVFDHEADTYWIDRAEPSPRADSLPRQY